MTSKRFIVNLGEEWATRLDELVRTMRPRTTRTALVILALEKTFGEQAEVREQAKPKKKKASR